MFTPLPLYSLKNRLQFRFGTTSFIYKAGYAENVRALGPYVDEIELLFLSSQNADWPTAELVRELKTLKTQFNLTYNIHLPVDIAANAANTNVACKNIDILQKFICQLQDLEPESYCLHLPHDHNANFAVRCRSAISALLATGLPRRKLTVENLDYPLTILADVIKELDVGVCLDIGHTFVFNTNFETHVQTFGAQIETVHLHGPGLNRDDHNDLSHLGPNWPMVLKFLRGFRGAVSLEVFDITKLNNSLRFLEPYLGELA